MRKNEKQTREHICARLKEIRIRKGLSTYKLADLSGVRQEYISRIERATVSVGIDVFLQLTDAMDVELELLEK